MERTDQQKELYDFLVPISKRPGMFVGVHQLNVVETFIDGYIWGALSLFKQPIWNVDVDMQNWFFRKYSASLSGTIRGWSLMYRYFGIHDLAIKQFADFVEETELTLGERRWDTVSEDIWSVSSHFQYNRVLPEQFAPVIEKSQEVFSALKKNSSKSDKYLKIVHLIENMIPEEYNDLVIHVHAEDFFRQVRFFYKTKSDGWIDSVSLAGQPGYYEQLVCLHAFVYLVNDLTRKGHIVTIKKSATGIEYELKACPSPEVVGKARFNLSKMKEELFLVNQFEKWKEVHLV